MSAALSRRDKSGFWYLGGVFGICHCKTQETSLFLLGRQSAFATPDCPDNLIRNRLHPLDSSATANFKVDLLESRNLS